MFTFPNIFLFVNTYKDAFMMKNEFEDILENQIKTDEYINEENYEILKGKFSKLINSQIGSRVLQNCIAKTSKEIIILIFNEIKDSISELIVNQYGNYFCQKFFSCLPIQFRSKFLESV